jgi:hypothetical protein
MYTDFTILCANTVPESYTWDTGLPLKNSFTKKAANSTVSTVSGYAPAVQVFFDNISVPDSEFELIDYSWNFGDYYNDTTNFVTLTCKAPIQHTYIMPGTYTVSLKLIQTRKRDELDQTENSTLCRSKFGIQWFWDNLSLINPVTSGANINQITWDETKCEQENTSFLRWRPKWWSDELACVQKYCKSWSWVDLSTNNSNPTKWLDAETDQEFEKKWIFEPNDTICSVNDALFLTTVQSLEQTTIKKHIIEVKEILPIAEMYSVSASIGQTPHQVRLSPKNSKAGSFPIDRIDWDFGDSSPIKTITRYATPLDDLDVINTEHFILDPEDVRNFDVLHTYKRNKSTYPVFYPSLTCYSACTNSTDSCCITIGPITLPQTTNDIHLLKSRNTVKGDIFVFSNKDTINISTNNQISATDIPIVPTVPTSPLRDTKNNIQPFTGNFNDRFDPNNFPEQYTPGC